jgi:hypothetical protein
VRLEALNAIAQLIAAVGVIASLFYLASPNSAKHAVDPRDGGGFTFQIDS